MAPLPSSLLCAFLLLLLGLLPSNGGGPVLVRADPCSLYTSAAACTMDKQCVWMARDGGATSKPAGSECLFAATATWLKLWERIKDMIDEQFRLAAQQAYVPNPDFAAGLSG